MHKITVSFGDGIGPSLMMIALNILRKVGAPLEIHSVEIGSRAFSHGFKYGIANSAMDKIIEYKILLQTPTSYPDNPEFAKVGIDKYLQCDTEKLLAIDFDKHNIKKSKKMIAIAHIGEIAAIFEPCHDAGENLAEDTANPCGMILACCLMLEYLGLEAQAAQVYKAIDYVLMSNYRTPDIATEEKHKIIGTKEFGNNVLRYL